MKPCTLTGTCTDPLPSNERGGPSTGLLGHAVSGEAWTGYADAEVDENGEMRLRAMERAKRYRAAHAKLPDSVAAFTATLASLRPAWAAVGEANPAWRACSFDWSSLIASPANRDSSAGERDSEHPVRYALHCDRPGCAAELQANGRTDSDARRTVTLAAEARGWQISRWRDVPVDLCPEHREEGWAEGPPRVSLAPGVRDARRKR